MSFNPLVYRTDDLSRWGTGKGSDLAAVEFDNDIWNLNSRIATIEGSAAAKQIDYIAESGGSLFVHYTDHTIDGPFPLPIATITWVGAWQANTAYTVGNVLYYLGGIYFASNNFTSGTTFATGTGGTTWLVLMLQIPAIGVATVTTATFTPDMTFANIYIRFTNSGGCAVTIPPFSSVPYILGTEMHFRDATTLTSGGVTVAATSPVVIHPVTNRSNATMWPGATIFVKNVAVDTWDIGGALL